MLQVFFPGFLDELEKISTDLTASSRDKIKEKNFALPDERRYPIHDESHARAALSMVSAHGSPAEKAQVHAAVAKKWPGLAARSSVIKKESAAPEKETRKAWSSSSTRSGRRPMRVATLLRKEKDGTLGGYKLAEALFKIAQFHLPIIPFTDGGDRNPPVKRPPGKDKIPSREYIEAEPKREDGREFAMTINGPAYTTADIAPTNLPQERST